MVDKLGGRDMGARGVRPRVAVVGGGSVRETVPRGRG